MNKHFVRKIAMAALPCVLALQLGCSSDYEPMVAAIEEPPDDTWQPDPDRVAAGQVAYFDTSSGLSCANSACHGSDGKGPSSAALIPQVRAQELIIDDIFTRMPPVTMPEMACDLECATNIVHYLQQETIDAEAQMSRQAAADEASVSIANGGIEDGIAPWISNHGSFQVQVSNVVSHGGEYSLVTVGRSAAEHGPQQILTDALKPGQDYIVSVWVRMAESGAADVTTADVNMNAAISQVTAQQDIQSVNYEISEAQVTSSEWTLVEGTFNFDASGILLELAIQIQGPDAELDFYIDDFAIVEADKP